MVWYSDSSAILQTFRYSSKAVESTISFAVHLLRADQKFPLIYCTDRKKNDVFIPVMDMLTVSIFFCFCLILFFNMSCIYISFLIWFELEIQDPSSPLLNVTLVGYTRSGRFLWENPCALPSVPELLHTLMFFVLCTFVMLSVNSIIYC